MGYFLEDFALHSAGEPFLVRGACLSRRIQPRPS
jgi:hypothetical protein